MLSVMARSVVSRLKEVGWCMGSMWKTLNHISIMIISEFMNCITKSEWVKD